MTARLRIAPGFSFPIDVVTESIAILAKRGAGKTYAASVLVEEMLDAGLQVVVVDPIGAWWGLRSSADGKGAGFPVPILGGEHGDVPLEAAGGQVVADLVVDERLSAIVDLSAFSKTDWRRFVADFIARLYQRNREAMHVVLEEADLFAPEGKLKRAGDEQMLGAVYDLVRRGRGKGLGSTLITQRSASISKEVLTQAEILVALRTTGPHDRRAIDEWVRVHDEALDVDALASLPTGEAWVSWPVEGILKRVKIRRRRTFDSSATPKPGQVRRQPKTLADVDLQAFTKRMAATIERAKETDPRELAKRVRELEAELRKAKAPPAEKIVETVVEQVEVKVPVLANGVVGKLEAVAAAIAVSSKELASVAETMVRELAPWREGPPAPSRLRVALAPATQKVQVHASLSSPSSEARKSEVATIGDITLGKGEKTVLGVLRQWPEGRTYNELAFLAGYSAKASTLGVILAKLRGAGYVEPGNHPVRLTPAGLEAAGGYDPLPTGPTLLQHWLGHQRMGKGEREVLLVLVDQYPKDLSHEELCELAGYSPTASTMGVILSKLRKLGLVEKNARRLAPEFAETIQ